MKPVTILGFCVLGLLAQASYAVKIYMWTDAQGTTHYGEHPPKDVKATLIDARTGHSAPPPEPDSNENNKTDDKQVKQQTSVKDPERCALAQKNLSTLTTSARVKIPDNDGNLRYLTEQEKQQKIDDMQKIVSENCE